MLARNLSGETGDLRNDFGDGVLLLEERRARDDGREAVFSESEVEASAGARWSASCSSSSSSCPSQKRVPESRLDLRTFDEDRRRAAFWEVLRVEDFSSVMLLASGDLVADWYGLSMDKWPLADFRSCG